MASTPATSAKRFPDGAQYRFEIPSVEGPDCLRAVIDAAEHLEVPVHRVSQGSGVFMLTDAEVAELARLGAAALIEVSLFARPTAGWGLSASARSAAGSYLASACLGTDGLAHAVADIRRAADFGIRSVLIADLGLLAEFGRLRRAGELPPEMRAKVSVMLPAANPSSARVLEDLGADSINLPCDLTLAQIAEIRAAVDVPLDLYVEAPDDLGGFVRHYEIPELVRVGAPIYLKFGLRNSPGLYPSGGHLQDTAVALCRERVRRARIAHELIARSGAAIEASVTGAADLAAPDPATIAA